MRRGKGEDNRMKRDGKTEKNKKEEKGKRGRGIKRNRNGLKQIKSFREDSAVFRTSSEGFGKGSGRGRENV